MSATIKNIGPTIIASPPSRAKLIEGGTDSHQHDDLATPLNPSTLQDALLVQVKLKRKLEAGSEDVPPGEGTETELGSRTKRPRVTSLTSNPLPSLVATTAARNTSYSITPISI